MARVSDVYGGQYLKAITIGDDSYDLTIATVKEELIGETQDRKLVVYFQGTPKGLVLNATNANTLAEAYGDDSDNWAGHKVRLYTVDTEFGGRRVKGLRLDVIDGKLPKTNPVQQPPDFSNESLSDGDELPF